MSRVVPGLGHINGLEPSAYPAVEQYRGIPYGIVPERFRQARLSTSWPNAEWDGTKHGPICPFPKMVIGMTIVQKRLAPEHDYAMDEFKCLNLNISCPKSGTPDSKYPVVVWVHGGGNVVGMGSDAGYNGAPLADFSVQRGMPTVVVTINYRLGAFGFLASEDIKHDNEAAGDGGCGNYGVRDQLLAYEWIKTNIKAFGGDPARITAMGESAGSIDMHLAMCSELFAERFPFSQAILQSGVASLAVRSLEVQQCKYDKILAFNKITSESTPSARLQALRSVSSDNLCKSYVALGAPVAAWQATVDGYFLKKTLTVSDLPSQKYDPSIKRLLIGDCAHEGTIFALPRVKREWTFEKLYATADKILGADKRKEVFDAYNITEESDAQEITRSLTRVSTDAEWSQPIETVARSFAGPVYYYHMVEGNPFEGPLKGLAGHGTDLLYVFLTYQGELAEHLRQLGESVAAKWLAFINGKEPWTQYSQKVTGESELMRFGPNGQSQLITERHKASWGTLRLTERLQESIGHFAGALRGE